MENMKQEDMKQNVVEEAAESKNELFEEVEEAVTAAWSGCATCCS